MLEAIAGEHARGLEGAARKNHFGARDSVDRDRATVGVRVVDVSRELVERWHRLLSARDDIGA
jgi:hypothetical protein